MGPVLAETEAWGWAPLDTLNSKGQFRCDVRAGEQDCGHPAWEGRQLPEAVTPEVSCLPVPLLLGGPSQGRLARAAGPCFVPCRTEHCRPQVLWPLRGNPRRRPKEAETFPRVHPFPAGSSPGTLEDLVPSDPTLGERLELCRFQN